MTPTDALNLLERRAARWRRRRALRASFVVLGVALLAGAGGVVANGGSMQAGAVTGLVVFGAGMGVWMWTGRGKRATARDVARHFDRTRPELEESCTLLLEPEDRLSALARLQRERVARRLSDRPPEELFPARRLARAGAFLFVSTLLAGVLVVWAPGALRQAAAGSEEPERPQARDSVSVDVDLPHVEKLMIRITPPAYTGLPSRWAANADLEVVEGAEVVWTATFTGPVDEARWVFSDGRVLDARPDSSGTARVARTVREAGFYSIEATAAGETSVSDYHRLDVARDAPPVIVVDAPAPRVRIEPRAERRVQLDARVEDDYGVASTVLVATVAKGTGENVRFREQTLPFDRVDRVSPREHRLRKDLDLDALEMEPGDELYFWLRAEDNRRPEPQSARTETHFVLLPDTAARMQVASEGFGVDLVPEYFRSQRQIIIDTEALIEDRRRGAVERRAFEERSNDIGIDQKLLRLRYGQYLGEEFETGIEAGIGEDEAGAGDEHEGHEHEEDERAREEAPGDITMEALVHMHDSEENATLFSTSVKTLLKASLAEMWEAELRLRTHRPEEALPFEYRALELLKETQQRARIYVRRIGFEPPPLKPEEQRLTGDLAGITPPRNVEDSDAEVSYPEIRAALAVLRGRSSDELLDDAGRRMLEAAGPTLARFAIEDPGRYLDALQALRTLLVDEEPCAPCRLTLERAFWQILPPAEVRPAPNEGRRSGLGAAYLRRLSGR